MVVNTIDGWIKYIEESINTDANQERKADAMFAYLAYNNEHKNIIEDKVDDVFDRRFKDRPISTIGYTKQITDSIATLYNADVKRDVIKKGKVGTKLTEYLNEKIWFSADTSFDEMNKLSFNQGTIAVQLAYSQKEERIKYITYPQFSIDVVCEKTNAVDKELKAVIISDYTSKKYWIYTDTYIHTVNIEENIRSSEEHGLGFLPFIILHSKDPGLNKYIKPSTHMANQDVLLNFSWSNVFNIQTNQTNAVPVITQPVEHSDKMGNYENDYGLSPTMPRGATPEIPLNDSNKVLNLYNEEGMAQSDFKYVTPSVDFDGAIKVIKESEKSFALSYGLPPDFFDTNSFAKPATTALLQNTRLRGMVKAMEHRMIVFENEVFEMSRDILIREASPPSQIGSISSITVDFMPDSEFKDVSVDEAIKLKQAFVLDEADILMRLEPFLSREDALKKLEERYPTEKEEENADQMEPVDEKVEKETKEGEENKE